MKATLKQVTDADTFAIVVEDAAGSQLAGTEVFSLSDLKFVDYAKQMLGASINTLIADLGMDICDGLTLLEPVLKELEDALRGIK